MDINSRVDQLERKVKSLEEELEQLRRTSSFEESPIPPTQPADHTSFPTVDQQQPEKNGNLNYNKDQTYAQQHQSGGYAEEHFKEQNVSSTWTPTQQQGQPSYQQGFYNQQQVPYSGQEASSQYAHQNHSQQQPGYNGTEQQGWTNQQQYTYQSSQYNHGNQQQPPFPQGPPPVWQPPAPKDWEHIIAKVWLPRIFIVVLLIGILWGFTAAINAGLITRPVRILLGVITAAIMYWQGEVQIRNRRAALGQVILGGSIAVLMLTLAAAHMLYGYFPAVFAFIFYLATIALGVWVAIRHRSQTLIIVTMIAGYLVPFLMVSSKPNVWVFVGYEALFSIAMILISFRYSFKASYYVAVGLLHLPLLFGSFGGDYNDSRYAIIIAVLIQHAVLFYLATFKQTDNKTEPIVILLTSFGLLVLWSFGLLEEDYSLLYGTIIATWSLIYSATAYWLYMNQKISSVHIGIATFGWLIWILDVMHGNSLSSALIVISTLAIMIGLMLKSKTQQIVGTVFYIITAVVILIEPMDKVWSMATVSWLLLIASLALLYYFISKLPKEEGLAEFPKILLWSDVILTLYFLTRTALLLTENVAYEIQHLTVSAIWVAYSVAIIMYGILRQRRNARLIGVIFLLVTLLKVIFIDLPDVSTAIRAVLFIGLGVVGIVVSRLLYRPDEPTANDPPEQQIPPQQAPPNQQNPWNP